MISRPRSGATLSSRPASPRAVTGAALLLLGLAWLPVADPHVTAYVVFAQAHYRTVYSCPTPEDPAAECVTYAPGPAQTVTVPASACGASCSTGLTLPTLNPGDWLAFQLYAVRDGSCEGVTAAPPATP